MADTWNRPVRKSPRLKGYDYRQEGAYFVTICTHHREYLFGDVLNGAMHLSEIGQVADAMWLTIADHRPQIVLDAYVVMPNHVHGIVFIVDPVDMQPPSVGARRASSETRITRKDQNRSSGPKAQSLSAAIGSYKSVVTRQVRQLLQTDDTPIWQYSFHDHIIRNEEVLNHIREYVLNNPALWRDDTFYTDT